MAADVKVQFNERDLRRVKNMLSGIPRGLRRVMPRAINKTTRSARTQITRVLSGKTKLTQKTIRDAIGMYKATARWWSGLLRIRGGGIPLYRLKARQTKKGVSYADPEKGSRTLLPHAFINRQGLGDHVWLRSPGAGRLPIFKQYGPGLAEIYEEAPEIANRIQKDTGKKLRKEVFTQVRVLIEQQARRP